ncbi:diguanylate cyclase (GGDEF) domain-containing protein [Ruminococcus sp. YE71]|uniref:substrate-binding and GGDEF domain-containing protein n=1 Tax=unclassified Ruminococcus TaxID=2608920 RepID=UPI00088A8A20|nr:MULTISPECIES: GGDEF domain-containing protein [unclassified Ruminococcus]SDA18233.1 diguanylate cyclase (GGDEF) domain-containing protein [Ruminococcus sp. YE78]SFW30251.1 diguanylate cyclase (GGDEF) domain-containing protein [Ruminococcus sp. YE71]
MINSHDTVAVFTCSITGRYRRQFCHDLNTAAKEQGLNLVYFGFLGMIGEKDSGYGTEEHHLLDLVDLDKFKGVIIDLEGFKVQGMAERIVEKVRTAKCPVVSVSRYYEGLHNIVFDDREGIGGMIRHFTDVHRFTRIGYMSGPFDHPDAKVRLEMFRSVMREKGLPEDGTGVFEGDFWFNMGDAASDFFLSSAERPQAIVCANDYMAIALCQSLKNRGIRVPEDIAVSGFDGSDEAQTYLPHISTVDRKRLSIARQAFKVINDVTEGKEVGDVPAEPEFIFTHSCGCHRLNYRHEVEKMNRLHKLNRDLSYAMYDSESAIIKMSSVDSTEKLTEVLDRHAINFGWYRSFFVMTHTDSEGRPSYDAKYTEPSGELIPAVAIDHAGDIIDMKQKMSHGMIFPDCSYDEPMFIYVNSLHCDERRFGYTAVSFSSEDVYNEYYNFWVLNLAVSFETLLKTNRIQSLICDLENLSICDGLTGLLNRRGFDERTHEAIRSLKKGTAQVCTMVIDMDGLKRINDGFGHTEGDTAIKAAAKLIGACCRSGEIAGRAGGDEFYVFAPDYSQEKLAEFTVDLRRSIDEFNRGSDLPYKLDMSFGAYLADSDPNARLEDYLTISDSRMYKQKQAKPNRRK